MRAADEPPNPRVQGAMAMGRVPLEAVRHAFGLAGAVPAMATGDAETPLAAASRRFQEVHADVGRAMKTVFPAAVPLVAHGMAGWQVAVPDPAPESAWRGTMDRAHLQVFPSERRTGITIHVWDPKDPSLLARHEAMLREAGFKVMVGCLQWNRKAPLPVDAIEGLLRAAKAAW